MGLCLERGVKHADIAEYSPLGLLLESGNWMDTSKAAFYTGVAMSEFKVVHHVSELIKLLGVSKEGLSADMFADLLLKNKLPYMSTQVSSHNAVRRLADNSSSPQEFMSLYDDLKTRNVKDLNSFIYILSKLSEDPQTKTFLERGISQKPLTQDATSQSSSTSQTMMKMSDEEILQLRSSLQKATSESTYPHTGALRLAKEQNKENINDNVPSFPAWINDRPYLTLDFVELPSPQGNVGPLGTLPIATQEHILLEDILSCLTGVEGDYILTQALNDRFSVRNFTVDETTDPALKEMVKRILPVCTNYSIVIHFVEEKSAFECGLVNHALSASMKTLVKDYFLLIAQLEHQLRQGLLTMQKLWYFLQPTKHTLEILASIAIAITKANSKGGAVLSLLHEKTGTMSGDTKAQELCLFLIQSACVPYFETLEKWIYKGVIVDLYGEFLVEDHELVQKDELPVDYSNDYWEKRYTIRRERIPVFLEKVADMILGTGKYLNVIRQCGKDIRCPHAEEIVFTDKECHYVECIKKAYDFASKKLLDLLIEESDLMGRLRSVKHYFLLDQGDFIVQFMDMAEDELKKNINDIMPTRLESLLELALRTSVANSDPYNDDVRVELLPFDLLTQMFKILSIETKEEKVEPKFYSCILNYFHRLGDSKLAKVMMACKRGIAVVVYVPSAIYIRQESTKYRIPLELKLSGLEAFSFDYEVKWPLSLILNRKALACYQMLFRHLFYSKHVERLLCNVWISNKVAKAFPLSDAHSYGAAFALRQRMLNFVQNLEYYMMFEVLEPCWNVFLLKMQTVKNVDEVLLYHTEFLNMCLENCMLTSPELLRTVGRLMIICISFSNFIQRMNKYFVEAEMTGMSQSLTVTEETEEQESPETETLPAFPGESFEQRISRFDREFTELLVALLDRISEIGRDNYNAKLVNVLYRLDFNGFYTGHLENLAVERSMLVDHPSTTTTDTTSTLESIAGSSG